MPVFWMCQRAGPCERLFLDPEVAPRPVLAGAMFSVTMLPGGMPTPTTAQRALAILSQLAVPTLVSLLACGGSTTASGGDAGAETGSGSDSGSSSGGGSDSSGTPPPQAATACVLLGGVADTAQAWIWNGTTWTVAAGTPPQPGLEPDIGSLNGSLVVYGGYNGVGTWIWNGTQWSNPLTTAMSPPSRQSSALATLNDKVLLFGGCQSCGGNFGLMGDTWEWDGQSWTELHPAQSPPARFGAVAGTVAGKIVLFGGESYAPTHFNDTWEWDGENWSMASPSTSPSARVAASAAVASGTLLMFGGAGGQALQPLGDTWSWDGTNWTELTPTTSPSARAFAQMGSLRDTPVLFGGADTQGNVLGDTWTWTGTTWVSAPAATPTTDSSGSMGCY
jgi:hypothetical protein